MSTLKFCSFLRPVEIRMRFLHGIAPSLFLREKAAGTVPTPGNGGCIPICAPMAELTSDCGYRNSSDMMGSYGEAIKQCICANTSFNVSLIAPLCASCCEENEAMGMGMSGNHHMDMNGTLLR